ncbi:MAG: hypothetical protein U0230_25320 [Polyangiales bacterium]
MRKASTGRANAPASDTTVTSWAGRWLVRVAALLLAAAFVVIAGLLPTLAAAEALDDDGPLATGLVEELDDEEDPADPESLLELAAVIPAPPLARPPRAGTSPEPSHEGLGPDEGELRLLDRPPARG